MGASYPHVFSPFKIRNGRGPQPLFPVGDALAARGLAEATFEGHRFARAIGKEGAPRNFTEALWEPIPAESYQCPAAEMRDSLTR